MIRISQIRLPLRHTDAQLEQKIVKILKLKEETAFTYRIVKKSIDARKKPELFYSYAVDAELAGEEAVLKKVDDRNVTKVTEKKYVIPACGTRRRDDRLPTVIAGAGPAGLFCAYALAQSGIAPVVIERGKRVEERMRDVAFFWETGILNPASNVQFGEGGAGTFSDGKLNTLVKDPAGRNRFVLETFVRFGAPEEILYEGRPHIGTDVLSGVIGRMRTAMEEMGVIFRFGTCLTDYRTKDGNLKEIELDHKEWMPAGRLILAIGHSARDTFGMLAGERRQGRLHVLYVPGRLCCQCLVGGGKACRKRHELLRQDREKCQQCGDRHRHAGGFFCVGRPGRAGRRPLSAEAGGACLGAGRRKDSAAVVWRLLQEPGFGGLWFFCQRGEGSVRFR